MQDGGQNGLMKYVPLALLLASFSSAAVAQEAEQTAEDPPRMEAEFCFFSQGLKDELAKFDGLKASKRDTVGMVINLVFILQDGELPPDRVELRDGDQVDVLTLETWGERSMTRNLTPDIERASPEGRLCVVDPAREGRLQSELGYRFQSAANIRYLKTPGTHDLETLEDGLKDGRSHWKKMVGAMGFLVPKFDHIAVAGEDRDAPPIVTALKDGKPIGTPEGEFFDGARMVDIDVLEDLGADAIRVEASAYRMTPSPDAKTVKRFMGG